MMHRNGKKRLNVSSSHRRAMLRNQVIHMITYGHIVTTKRRAKEMRRLAEKVVTIAKVGNEFNARRRVKALLPYKEDALVKLFKEIAPKYTERSGGYTRLIPMGRRVSDTAPIARVEWV